MPWLQHRSTSELQELNKFNIILGSSISMNEKAAVIETEVSEEAIETKIDLNRDGKPDIILRLTGGLIILSIVVGIAIEHFVLFRFW